MINFELTFFGKFHIHRFGKSLCHSIEGAYISFEAAAGMNTDNCRPDCLRRYRNMATMLKIHQSHIEKNMLRNKTMANQH